MGLNWVWCGICAKYLAFGTYPTSTVGALRTPGDVSLLISLDSTRVSLDRLSLLSFAL